jgi:hypothetical protein
MGTGGEEASGRGEGKKKILRGEEDGSTLYMHTVDGMMKPPNWEGWREHNGGVNLSKVHCAHAWKELPQ